MTSSEKFAIAARMHVLLRRKTGRVTDTEWMASNPEYAAEIVRFSMDCAEKEDLPDLAELVGKLAEAMLPVRTTSAGYKNTSLGQESNGLIRYIRGIR